MIAQRVSYALFFFFFREPPRNVFALEAVLKTHPNAGEIPLMIKAFDSTAGRS